MTRLRLPMPAFLRIAERDGWTCHVCGVGYMAADPWEIDHEIPVARGGRDLVSNLRLSHRSCNRDKAAS